MELGGKQIPTPIEKTLIQIRDRVHELTKQYGSLARWGRPYFFNVKEVAVIVWLNEKLNVSLDRLAKFLGVDKSSLYKVMKKVESGKISYYDEKEGRVKVEMKNKNELIDMIDELLEAKAKTKVEDPYVSATVRKFMESKIRKRAIIKGHSEYLSDAQKREVVNIIKRLMKYINEKKLPYPSNPDMWNEDIVLDVLNRMLEEGLINPRLKRSYMIKLRAIPEWSQWFKGLMGASVKYAEPVERVIFYEDYMRLKEAVKNGELSEREFLVIALHIATGAREGIKQIRPKDDLDKAKSSLIGIKWENITWRGELYNDSCVIKVYESKTDKWWRCDPSWLDKDICRLLRKYAKKEGSVVKTLSGIKYNDEFWKWYHEVLRKASKILELPYTLKPHDMRRSSLSIKAELGIPLELAVSDKMPLGVGWEDLKTAVVYYLRFSRYTLMRIRSLIEQSKTEILKS